MGRRAGCLTGGVIGVFMGAGLLLAGIMLCLATLPHWMVVDQQNEKIEAIIVLGGGGGSRLKKGLELQELQPQVPLILVGRQPSDWQRNAHNCGSCDLNGRNVTYLSGSTNTASDADLVENWCKQVSVGKIAVITDPYHTRRADLIFKRTLSDVNVYTVSSGFYGKLRKPDEEWWRDRWTLELVWGELGKIVYFELIPFLKWYKDV